MTTNYKGYEIRTNPESHCALIYLNNKLVHMVAGDIKEDGTHNAIEKAKQKIDPENRIICLN